MSCDVDLGALSPDDITVELYYGKFEDNGSLVNSDYIEMNLENHLEGNIYEYKTILTIDDGGSYGYTFRVLPKHPLLINKQDLSLIKWLEK